jgi:hypothetical protein
MPFSSTGDVLRPNTVEADEPTSFASDLVRQVATPHGHLIVVSYRLDKNALRADRPDVVPTHGAVTARAEAIQPFQSAVPLPMVE